MIDRHMAISLRAVFTPSPTEWEVDRVRASADANGFTTLTAVLCATRTVEVL